MNGVFLMRSRLLLFGAARRANTLYLSSRRHGHTTGHTRPELSATCDAQHRVCPCGPGLGLRCIDSWQTNRENRHTADSLARFAARGLAAREVVQVHVHLAAVFDRRGCVAAEATADGVGDDTWLGLG